MILLFTVFIATGNITIIFGKMNSNSINSNKNYFENYMTTYSFRSKDYTLIIGGEGPTPYFEGNKWYRDEYIRPWEEYKNNIKKIKIEKEVTNIGRFLFYALPNLESVEIGNTVTSIEDDAFYDCKSLKKVTIPDSVTSIGKCAFDNCVSLKNIYYDGTKEEWNNISGVENISSINIKYKK